MNEIKVSRHAFKRAHQRLGLNKSAVSREAEKAFWMGQVSSTVKQSHLRMFLEDHKESGQTHAVLYHGRIWIYSSVDQTLITVYTLRNWWQETSNDHEAA
jgi:hypothetical protein